MIYWWGREDWKKKGTVCYPVFSFFLHHYFQWIWQPRQQRKMGEDRLTKSCLVLTYGYLFWGESKNLYSLSMWQNLSFVISLTLHRFWNFSKSHRLGWVYSARILYLVWPQGSADELTKKSTESYISSERISLPSFAKWKVKDKIDTYYIMQTIENYVHREFFCIENCAPAQSTEPSAVSETESDEGILPLSTYIIPLCLCTASLTSSLFWWTACSTVLDTTLIPLFLSNYSEH